MSGAAAGTGAGDEGAQTDAAASDPPASPRQPPARRRRRLRRGALIAGVTLAALVVAGLPFYVFPPAGDPAGAELIYVIGPPNPPRIAEAERLRAQLGAQTPVLVSVPPDRASWTRPLIDFCASADVVCETPDPFTTKGEALMLDRYREEHGFDGKAIILTATAHIGRTRYVFERCSPGAVSVVDAGERIALLHWAYYYVYQTVAWAKAVLTPCAAASE